MDTTAAVGDLANPFSLSDESGHTWLKGNLHTHSTNSDGKATPQQRVDQYAARGYDFLCLSDHNNITFCDSVSAPDSMVLIQGAELHPSNPFGGQTHHFLCLNMATDIDARIRPPQAVIDEVREQGGQVWLAHPHWSSVNILRDTMPLRGLSGVEVFNTTCRRAGRGESSTHWDDWMEQSGALLPSIANDDAHGLEEDEHDTYQTWTMVRARGRTPDAILEALRSGASYGSTGPMIHDIQLKRVASGEGGKPGVEASLRCSPAVRISAVLDSYGTEYWERGGVFESCRFMLRDGARWVRFEVIAPDGTKAWSNPFDLSAV